MDHPKISVLIGSKNRPQVLKKYLPTVLKQDYPNFEVVVLDDGSEIPYRNSLKNFLQSLPEYPPFRLLRLERSRGVAGGRNYLMQHADGDIFVFIDDDARFDNPKALQQVAEIFQKEPSVGILAFKILNHKNGTTEPLIPFTQKVRKKQPWLADRPTDVSYYLGGGHAIRREVIEDCGGYQDDLTFGEEELDLAYRAIEKGYRIRYSPEIVVHHYPQPSVIDRKGASGELAHHIKNRFYLACRYLPARYLPVYLPLWLSRYLIWALRKRELGQWLNGIRMGFRMLKNCRRKPLSPRAVRYLKRHHGRLWY